MNDIISARPLRLLHLAKYYPPEWGGMESVTRDLATSAHESGVATSVLAFTRNGKRRCETVDGVMVARMPVWMIPASQPLTPEWVLSAIRRGRGSDLVHVHLPNMLATLVLPFLSRKTRVVLHWHSDIVGKGLIGRLSRPLERWMAHRADAIIATSSRYAEHSPVLQRFANKVRVVPLGISDPAAGGTEGLAAALKSFLAERRFVLSVGRLVPYKGFPHLISAMKAIPEDICLIIVGDGDLRGMLAEQIAREGLSARILLAGKQSEGQLRALFAAASLYAMPSVERSEAFGVVLLEAMAFGLPVIATEIEGSGVPWVNQHRETGLNVPVCDPEALAAAITSILSDTKDAHLYGQAARARYVNHFTAERMNMAVGALYEELTTHGKKGSNAT